MQEKITEMRFRAAKQEEEIRHIHACSRKIIESLQDALTILRSISVENATDMEQIGIIAKEWEDVINRLENTLLLSHVNHPSASRPFWHSQPPHPRFSF